jgi:integrase
LKYLSSPLPAITLPDRLVRALDRLTIKPRAAELDLVVPKLAEALRAVELISNQQLPPAITALESDLEALLGEHSRRSLSLASPGARSPRGKEQNPEFGRYKDFPVAALFYTLDHDLIRGFQPQFHAAIGLLLLSRLDPESPAKPSDLEKLVASDIRKCFTSDGWAGARSAFPSIDRSLISRLRQVPALVQDLPPGQQQFFRSFARLLSDSRFRTFDRIEPLPPEDEATGGRELAANLAVIRQPLQSRAAETSEDDDLPEFLLEIDPASRQSGQTEDSERLRLINAAHRFVRDNQFLPYHLRSLLPEEAVETARLAMTLILNPEFAQAAFLGAMVLLTGHTPEDILDFVVTNGDDPARSDTPWGTHFLDLDSGKWWHSGPHCPGRFSPKVAQEVLLQPHASWIGLPLPLFILEFLRTRFNGRAVTVGNLTGIRAAQARSNITDFCRKVRGESSWTRVFPARLRADAFNWWIRQTSDDSSSTLACGNTEFAPTPPLYYYAEDADSIQRLHLQRMGDLGWPVSPAKATANARFGSSLQPTAAAISNLIAHLSGSVESTRVAYQQAPSPATIAAHHNAMVLHTAVMLIFASGHRRAIEYCLTLESISIRDQLLVIADKIISAANAARLLGLPAICVAQLLEYIAHLEVLAARVARYAPNTGARIRSLTHGATSGAKIHLFGLLTPDLQEWAVPSARTIEDLLGDAWPLPLHAPRHVLENGGRTFGLSAEFNHYRAGHIGLGQHPWSHWSPLTPSDTIRCIGDASDRMLIAQGWQVLPGIGGRPRAPSFAERTSPAQDERPHTLPSLQKARAALAPRGHRLVRTAIQSVKAKSDTGRFSESEVAQMREIIEVGASGDVWLAAAAINLLRRWLNRHDALLRSARLPGMALPALDPPVFSPNLVAELHLAGEFRDAFLVHLAQHRKINQVTARARVLVSLIAFGGLVLDNRIVPAIRALDSIFTADQKLWIELERRDGDEDLVESIRRPLDPISSCLLLQYRKAELISPKERPGDGEVLDEANRIVRQVRKEAHIDGLPGSIAAACTAMVPFYRYHLPGMLSAIGDGRADSHCLPRPDFIRVLEGHPTLGIIDEPTSPVSPSDKKTAHDDTAWIGVAKQVLREIAEILREALPPTALGGKRASEYQLKQSDVQEKLANIRLPEKLPGVLLLLIAWVRSMSEEGGRSGRQLRTSSVRTYWHRIASPLVEIGLRVDFNDADEEELEDLYCQILDLGPRRSRPRRARVLRDFHERCGMSLPELDWYEIEPRINLDVGRVDANLITPIEYQRMLDKLAECYKIRPAYARSLACFILLMYKGGLRIGDVLRLSLDDVRVVGSNVIIHVRRNAFGRPKTRAGRRIVRLTSPTLRDTERELIEGQIQIRRDLCRRDAEEADNDARICCFGPGSDGMGLYDRQSLQNDLCEIMRWATGRLGSHPHHLRHSYGSYNIAATMPIDPGSVIFRQLVDYFSCENPASAVLKHHLNDTRLSRRVIHAIAAELGHASPDTTFTYEHLHECGLACALWRSAPDRVDAVELVTSMPSSSRYMICEVLTGLSNADLRQLKSRGKDVGDPRVLAEMMIRRNPISHGVPNGEACDPTYVPNWVREEVTLEAIHLALVANVDAESDSNVDTAACGEANADDEDGSASLTKRRSSLSDETVAALLDVAHRHRRACKYQTYFAASHDTSQNRSDLPLVPTNARTHGLTSRFNSLLSRLGEPIIRDGINVWARNYRPSVTGLAASDNEELVSIVQFILASGFPIKKVRLSFPESFPIERKKDTIRALREAKIPLLTNELHTPSKGQARSSQINVHLLLEDADGSHSRARRMAHFHQLCYLLWLTSLRSQTR